MVTVVGVRFKPAGKIYYFDPGELTLELGDYVIVETARGLEYGEIASAPEEVSKKSVVQPLKKVIRTADAQDRQKHEENLQKKQDALEICQKKIDARGLEMKLIDAEYTFDNTRKGRFPRAGKGSGQRVQDEDRAAPDRRAGRGEDAGRHRNLRQRALLPHLASGV